MSPSNADLSGQVEGSSGASRPVHHHPQTLDTAPPDTAHLSGRVAGSSGALRPIHHYPQILDTAPQDNAQLLGQVEESSGALRPVHHSPETQKLGQAHLSGEVAGSSGALRPVPHYPQIRVTLGRPRQQEDTDGATRPVIQPDEAVNITALIHSTPETFGPPAERPSLSHPTLYDEESSTIIHTEHDSRQNGTSPSLSIRTSAEHPRRELGRGRAPVSAIARTPRAPHSTQRSASPCLSTKSPAAYQTPAGQPPRAGYAAAQSSVRPSLGAVTKPKRVSWAQPATGHVTTAIHPGRHQSGRAPQLPQGFLVPSSPEPSAAKSRMPSVHPVVPNRRVVLLQPRRRQGPL